MAHLDAEGFLMKKVEVDPDGRAVSGQVAAPSARTVLTNAIRVSTDYDGGRALGQVLRPAHGTHLERLERHRHGARCVLAFEFSSTLL